MKVLPKSIVIILPVAANLETAIMEFEDDVKSFERAVAAINMKE